MSFNKCRKKYQDQSCAVPELHGHVMAIDGLAIRIRTPRNTETGNVMSYKNRKGFSSINIQAGCDSLLKFRFVSIMTAGSTHDNTAYLASGDSSLWENDTTVDRLGRPFWRSGDNAYSCTKNFINPWPGVNLINRFPFRDSFNYRLSGGYRNSIERAFGVLYARWGIFWRPLCFRLSKLPVIIFVICKLHNFCLDEKELEVQLGSGLGEIKLDENIRQDGHQNGYDDKFYVQDQCQTEKPYVKQHNVARFRDSKKCPLRTEMTDLLESHGSVRPSISTNIRT